MQHSTSHALINTTGNIRKAINEREIVYRAFADLQKAFDAVDHQILLARLSHWDLRSFK